MQQTWHVSLIRGILWLNSIVSAFYSAVMFLMFLIFAFKGQFASIPMVMFAVFFAGFAYLYDIWRKAIKHGSVLAAKWFFGLSLYSSIYSVVSVIVCAVKGDFEFPVNPSSRFPDGTATLKDFMPAFSVMFMISSFIAYCAWKTVQQMKEHTEEEVQPFTA